MRLSTNYVHVTKYLLVKKNRQNCNQTVCLCVAAWMPLCSYGRHGRGIPWSHSPSETQNCFGRGNLNGGQPHLHSLLESKMTKLKKIEIHVQSPEGCLCIPFWMVPIKLLLMSCLFNSLFQFSSRSLWQPSYYSLRKKRRKSSYNAISRYYYPYHNNHK